MKMEEKKIIKVNCSFCGKEIECPEDMLKNVEGHMCFQCFSNPPKELPKNLEKFHVDIPTKELKDSLPEILGNKLVEEVFPGIWKQEKERLKQMPRKELAEEMFFEGVCEAAHNLVDMKNEENK